LSVRSTPSSLRRRKRNVVLKWETYRRLELFLLEKQKELGRRLTFDDAVRILLDHYLTRRVKV